MTAPSIKSFYNSPDEREIMPYPSLEDIATHLTALQKDFPDLVRVEEAGQSVEERTIWLIAVTDTNVCDDSKQVVMCIGQEHGEERSSSLSVLELLDWLVTPEAREALRHNIVLLIPCVNPDAWETREFFNKNGVNLFIDYSIDGECSQPESETVRRVMEQYQPEVLVNLHGRSTGSAVRAVEGSGLAYASSQYERSHSRLFVEELALAAEAAGYPQDRGEEDAEQIVAWIPGGEYRCFGSMFSITTGVYAYHRFHTLSVCMEVCEPHSGVVRIQRLLQLGCQRWRTEGRPGYPVNVMAWNCHGFLCASGRDATELRVSRMELWRMQGRCAFGWGVPARVGFEVAAFSPQFADKAKWSSKPLSEVLTQLEGDPAFDVAAMRDFCSGIPELYLLLTEERGKPELKPENPIKQLTSPIGLRLRLPANAAVQRVQINGQDLPAAAMNGYSVWDTPNGFRMLQADLAPDFATGSRFVMMVRY